MTYHLNLSMLAVFPTQILQLSYYSSMTDHQVPYAQTTLQRDSKYSDQSKI